LEKCDREWLVYSKELDKVFCFCCKLFKKGNAKGNLDDKGYGDWHHVAHRLKDHEKSLVHLTNRNKWFEMRKRLKMNETIDKIQHEDVLKLFETLETSELSNPIDVLKFMKELDYFPNACIAYRILLPIPVTVASAEESFSKLKLLKSYLRSTMTQERLSGLAMISIENEMLESINYEELINQFAIKNARRASRIIG